ncbi:MAG: hypothetical protein ACRBN8_10735 [Nannocystales bacterium]
MPGRSLTRRSVAVAFAICTAGCGPEIPFTWQVVDVLDLGMNVEVTELGPLGNPPESRDRAFQEAMPLDRIRASVMVADTDGPVSAQDLSFAWFACSSTACDSSLDTPACPEEGVELTDCALGTAPEITFQFADLDDPEESLLALATGRRAIVRAIGGLRDDPGPQACLERLESGSDLGRCLIVDGLAPQGSLGELFDLYESRGGVLPDDPLLDLQRQFVRNRTPLASQVWLRREGAESGTQVFPEQPISAQVDEVLEFEWRASEADLEEVTVVIDSTGTTVTSFDTFTDSWWTTQRATEFDDTGLSPSVRWVVGPQTGTFTLYTVIRDDSDATDWATFTVEVSG